MGAGLQDVMPQIIQLFALAILGFIALYFRFRAMRSSNQVVPPDKDPW
jgi:hypothetical protein